RKEWQVVGGGVVTTKDDEGNVAGQRISFATDYRDLRLTKTFTLRPQDYHVGLEVKVERRAGAKPETKEFRYQLDGAKGLPIEGVWFASVLRKSLIGRVQRSNNELVRSEEDVRRIAQREGGDEVRAEEGSWLRYAGVAVQYFGSVIAVDNDQEKQDFLASARPSLVRTTAKGRIRSIRTTPKVTSFELDVSEGPGLLGSLFGQKAKKEVIPFVLHPQVKLPEDLKEGEPMLVVYETDEYDQRVAVRLARESDSNPLWLDDISAHVATAPFQVEDGKPVVHRYVLYNGPVKVRLLGHLEGDKAVPQELINRYDDDLRLDTLTDYHSNSVFGKVAYFIGWTRLLIWITNFMHEVLWYIHKVIPVYGLCIIVLTIMVRALMFPLSRKQALASQRMQARMQRMQPELNRLKEKYKDDPETLKLEQMRLYQKHGLMNPLGSCWVAFLQMPIFMGLYYALQESILFRLEPFLWIRNLGAPDMLLYWTDKIPILSNPENYGGGLLSFLYLGPYFNLLPVIAVCFYLWQSTQMMPPAADEQQAMQQKTMKWMTVLMGLFFYKVAAGLCLYFIASSLWGFCERKLVKRMKATLPEPEEEGGGPVGWLMKRMEKYLPQQQGPTPALDGPSANGPTETGIQAGRDRRKDRRDRRKQRRPGPGGPPAPAPEPTAMDKLRNWWQELLKQASKK
ncbi:MAG TPA: YidC/Oxa1 family membrane protein insertase, partial [Gemmataceae bacterium]|nr:YidC/Oxa1 family membrane protein insertase [Gemmataceae bacterium]